MGVISETSPIIPVMTTIPHGPQTVSALPLLGLGVISVDSLKISLMTGIPHGLLTVNGLPLCLIGMEIRKST